MFSKSSFGTPNSSFGLTSNSSLNTSFSKPSTTFGQPQKSLFGVSALGSNFGQSSQNPPIFGSKLFGSTPGAANNSFGNANNSIFGLQNKTTGLNEMETASSQTSGIFLTSTPNDQLGTPIKFVPSNGTESLPKGGINHTLNIRYQTITCMNEYDAKSFEELRLEDYQLNRKGPQQSFFGTMSQSSGAPSFFNNTTAITSANSIFGQKDNKSIFGQTASGTGFGQANSVFGITSTKNTTAGIFNNMATGFGANVSTTTASPFNSTAQANNLFGSAAATNNPFLIATPTSTSFRQSSGFGSQATFGATQTATNQNNNFFNQNTNLFNQNKTSPFNFTPTSTATAVGIFGQPIAQNTNFNFSGPTTTTSSTITTPFGQTNQGKLFNSPANKSVTPLLGQRQKSNSLGGGGFPIGGGLSFFVNNASKPNVVNNNNMGQLINFGATASPSFNTMQGTTPQIASIENKGQQQIISMAINPYGTTNLLNNISITDNDIHDYTKPTNPIELSAILKGIKKLKTSIMSEKMKPTQVFGRKVPFSGLEYYDENLILNNKINYNPKRLLIRNKSNRNQISLDGNLIESSASGTVSVTENENLEEENVYSDLRALRKKVALDEQRYKQYSHTNNNTNISNNLSLSSMVSPERLVFYTSNNNDTSESTVGDETEFIEPIEADLQLKNADDLDNISTSTDSYETSVDLPIVQYPAGIILTRPEYYTVPALDELVNYIDADGCCLIQGFTIGRYGYGSVCFTDTFDVSNINIDELVHFRHKEINIYPDESKTPPLGQGLNRKGQVTLDKVWPRDKKTKALITDVATLIEMDYAGTLRRMCEKQKTWFVDYRPDTGSWVFKVDHF